MSLASELAASIDHTLLRPDATAADVRTLCQEARDYGFYSVCVNGTWVTHCRRLLEGSGVKICAVVGFPLGAMTSQAKAFEAAEAVTEGADEIDMVLPIWALKEGSVVTVEADILAVVAAAAGRPVKVILETGLLTDAEKRTACLIAKEAGAAFVKTSTGFAKGSQATVADIALMRQAVGPDLGVKASGGVRTLADARSMLAAGATRIGASSGVAIVTEAQLLEP